MSGSRGGVSLQVRNLDLKNTRNTCSSSRSHGPEEVSLVAGWHWFSEGKTGRNNTKTRRPPWLCSGEASV